MARTLYAATGNAIARISNGDVALLAEGSGARCVAVAPDGTVFAGGPHGVVRGDGTTLLEGDVFSVAVSPVDGSVYAGCEPSALWRSDDGGETWRELEALLELPSRPSWSFPPRPWTSHVRWIAPSPVDSDLLLVGIELGGLMRSADGGETWDDHRPGAQPDVHTLAWHPGGRAYEAGGGGAAWSDDGGDTWTPADEGRDRNYCWAVASDPADPDRWWVSASTGPFAAHGRGDPEARLYERRGDRWQEVAAFDSMPYALLHAGGRLLVGLRDGRILAGDDVVARVPAVHALAVG